MVKILNLRFIPGALNGFTGASLLARLEVTLSRQEWLNETHNLQKVFATITREVCNGESLPAAAFENPADLMIYGADLICRAANYPVFQKGRGLHTGGVHCVVGVPVFAYQYKALIPLLTWLAAFTNHRLAAGGKSVLETGFKQAFAHLESASPSSTNVPRFLRAALAANIPTLPVVGRVIQYGQGARNRWLDSSFTDRTPNISAVLARNKQMTALVLKTAGLPVPSQKQPTSAEEAIRMAQETGYPVVIKPADKDGGLAVSAGLQTEGEVRRAFARARSETANVILEKHIPGRDYRINVCEQRVLWAIERIPAGVTGDGRSSIRQLVEKANSDPRRGTGQHTLLKSLALDDEAKTLLARRNLEQTSVPPRGEFVPLRRRANIGAGGMPVSVMDQMHPDNATLAINAAKALRLDIAGVDLLLPDISLSWRETGGAICEVNGQPQLGGVTSAHVYREVLGTLIRGNGRIPIALVAGAANDRLVLDICAHLQQAGLRTGYSSSTGVWANGELISSDISELFRGGQVLMRNSEVDAVVLSANDMGCNRSGLPFDSFDLLLVAGERIEKEDAENTDKDTLLRILLPYCKHGVQVPRKLERQAALLERLAPDFCTQIDSAQSWAEDISAQMLTLRELYDQPLTSP